MAAPADAAAQAPHEARLAGIHAEAKKQFFAAVATYLGRHPAQDQLTAGDAVRLMEAEGKIPFSKQYRAFDGEVVLAGGAEKHEEGYGGWAHSVANPLIDVVTPSHNVFFVVPQYLQDVRNGYGSGTSLAVPLAAGVVALMKSAAPPTPALLKKPAAYVQLIAKALRESARLDLLNEPEPNDWVGHGLVDALGAIEAARRMMPVDRPAAR